MRRGIIKWKKVSMSRERRSAGFCPLTLKVAVTVLGMFTCSPLSGLFEFWGRAEEVLLEK